MTGTPIPYNIGNDNLLLSLFLLSLLGNAYIFLVNGGNIAERTKSMFYHGNRSNPYNNRTNINRVSSTLLYAQFVFYSCIIAFGLLQPSGIITEANSKILFFSFAAILAVALIAKRLLYDFVNKILFSTKQAREWRDSYFFTIQLSGYALIPPVIAFFFISDFSHTLCLVYIVFIIVVYLFSLFMRCINFIFTEKRNIFDIFLYLCAIELLPMLFIWKAILETSIYLTIKN